VCLGDSLTEGFGVAPERSWPSLLQERLRDAGRAELRVVNAGISGSTSASAVSRVRWQLAAHWRGTYTRTETVHLNILLLQFQRQRTHMAILLDEYGGVEGMVTLEDVLEELVGQIQDEFDREAPLILAQEAGRFVVEGKCPLNDLEKKCRIEIPEIKAVLDSTDHDSGTNPYYQSRR